MPLLNVRPRRKASKPHSECELRASVLRKKLARVEAENADLREVVDAAAVFNLLASDVFEKEPARIQLAKALANLDTREQK